MKKALFLVTVLVASIVTVAQVPQYEVDLHNKYQQELRNIQAPDTFVNNGDGKVVIIDKRPRTIINKQQPPKTVEQQPVIVNIPENRDLENYLYYHNTDNRGLSTLEALLIFVGVMVILFFIWMKNENENKKCECKCCNNSDDNYKDASVVNHFHVSGGSANALIDTSLKAKEANTSLGTVKQDEIVPLRLEDRIESQS